MEKKPYLRKNPVKDKEARVLDSVFGCHKLNSSAEMLFPACVEITENGQNHFFLEISVCEKGDFPFIILTIAFMKRVKHQLKMQLNFKIRP